MGRLLLALPASVMIVVSLFSFMAWMVDTGSQRAPKPSQLVRFDMVMVENDADVQRRQRAVPERPEQPKAPQPMDFSQAETQLEPIGPAPLSSELGLNTALDGVAISVPDLQGTMGNRQALPLYRVEPRYPAKALKRKVEGYVILQFTIDTAGRPKDIKVLDAKPKRMFEREAMRALKQYKYQPKVEHGVSVEQQGQTYKMEFNLAK
ncbi:energy transducer TonB [Vibrio sp. CAU 1672]|uniref:energy transducer TonB n=1 Tax=Vibrio sp. CAU 1672 TaxID=3032594 RepID=UPI0023DC74F4|nr:energy transducer TonB [Vibrio sp. CAU 1672]MDF2155786.1 TonB family protein [Vibrio sp. CAU 1672]